MLFWGDFLFKILTFRQISCIAAVICLLLLLGSAISVGAPAVGVFSGGNVTVPVIMYHQISENSSVLGKYAITPELLREDFQYMKAHNINPVSIKEVTEYIKGGKSLPKNPVILTFDDGEKTFITKVLPLMKEYSYPANVNVVGALVELYTKNKETDDRYAYLNAEDIKALAKEPLAEIGCHTYNMHSLNGRRGMGRLYGESEDTYIKAVAEDLGEFNNLLTTLTGEKPLILAYPYGIRNNVLFEYVKEQGYTITLTCREETNVISRGGNLYELGRFNRPYGTDSEEFFGKIFNGNK